MLVCSGLLITNTLMLFINVYFVKIIKISIMYNKMIEIGKIGEIGEIC